MIIGEPYFVSVDIPQELIDFEGQCHTELELFQIARQEGCDIAYVAHSRPEDWDRYALNHFAELRSLKTLADPLKYQERLNWIRQYQDMSVSYRRDMQDWAMYVLV
jgi:hypothetical protein